MDNQIVIEGPEGQTEATIDRHGDAITVDMWYPQEGRVSHVEVGLCDVRAADSVRLRYDFSRDGWVVEQASTFEWEADDEECDPDWQEVAFVEAWARERPRQQ